MKNANRRPINLIGDFVQERDDNHTYKGEYNRLFPTKLSSSAFLTLYTLYTLNANKETMFGTEILDEISEMLGESAWKPSHGTLYPLLKRLETEGLIYVADETKSKKYYGITFAGKQYLKENMESFKTMLAASSNFFSRVMIRMYSGDSNVEGGGNA